MSPETTQGYGGRESDPFDEVRTKLLERIPRLERELEEARRREATLREHATKQAAELAEARQERDTWKRIDEEKSKILRGAATRIGELEAALREAADASDARDQRDYLPHAYADLRAIARRALQPTMDACPNCGEPSSPVGHLNTGPVGRGWVCKPTPFTEEGRPYGPNDPKFQ